MRPNTIAKAVLLSFSSIVLVSTFQNCAQATGTEAFVPVNSGSSSNAVVSDSYEKVDGVDLSAADYIVVSLRSLYAEGTQRRMNKEFQNLQINLSNGEMRSVDSDGSILSPVRLCLKRQELEEFKAVLRNTHLCQPIAAREDEVCTQIYKYPLALLQYGNGDQVKIGEVAGCSKSLDLCEENRDVYNGFIAYLRNNLEGRKCL